MSVGFWYIEVAFANVTLTPARVFPSLAKKTGYPVFFVFRALWRCSYYNACTPAVNEKAPAVRGLSLTP